MIIDKIDKFFAENYTGDNFLTVLIVLLKVAEIKLKIRKQMKKNILQKFFPKHTSSSSIPDEKFEEDNLKKTIITYILNHLSAIVILQHYYDHFLKKNKNCLGKHGLNEFKTEGTYFRNEIC